MGRNLVFLNIVLNLCERTTLFLSQCQPVIPAPYLRREKKRCFSSQRGWFLLLLVVQEHYFFSFLFSAFVAVGVVVKQLMKASNCQQFLFFDQSVCLHFTFEIWRIYISVCYFKLRVISIWLNIEPGVQSKDDRNLKYQILKLLFKLSYWCYKNVKKLEFGHYNLLSNLFLLVYFVVWVFSIWGFCVISSILKSLLERKNESANIRSNADVPFQQSF